MEALAARFPDDTEARIFLALALLGTAPANDTSLAQQRRAGEILNAELARQPQHPGIVHYLIHSFDYPELAELALPAARVYAEIAPASPHAQHMPSHIFTRLGLWQESIRSNLDSEASANAIAAKKQTGAVPFDALHALDYLEYAYLQTGQIDEAKEVVDRVRASRVVRFAVLGRLRAGRDPGALRARAAGVEGGGRARSCRKATLPWERFPYALALTHFARAIGAARMRRRGGGASARSMTSRRSVRSSRPSPIGRPLRLGAAGRGDAVGRRRRGWRTRSTRTTRPWTWLRRAADLQDRVGKHPVTPGELLPARELLADLLAELGAARRSAGEYEATLVSNPGRLNALRGAAKVAAKVGEAEQGARAARRRSPRSWS